MDQHWHLEYTPTYLYILACQNDTFYVGMTSNLQKRLAEHIKGHKGAPHTKSSGVSRLVTATLFPDRESAWIAEQFVTYYFKPRRQSSCSDEDTRAFIEHYYRELQLDPEAVHTFQAGVGSRLLKRCVAASSTDAPGRGEASLRRPGEPQATFTAPVFAPSSEADARVTAAPRQRRQPRGCAGKQRVKEPWGLRGRRHDGAAVEGERGETCPGRSGE
jgi:putative endonuclease